MYVTFTIKGNQLGKQVYPKMEKLREFNIPQAHFEYTGLRPRSLLEAG